MHLARLRNELLDRPHLEEEECGLFPNRLQGTDEAVVVPEGVVRDASVGHDIGEDGMFLAGTALWPKTPDPKKLLLSTSVIGWKPTQRVLDPRFTDPGSRAGSAVWQKALARKRVAEFELAIPLPIHAHHLAPREGEAICRGCPPVWTLAPSINLFLGQAHCAKERTAGVFVPAILNGLCGGSWK